MQFDKLTTRAQESLQSAQKIAAEHNHQALENEHLLVALLDQDDGFVSSVLRSLGSDPKKIRDDANALVDSLPAVRGSGSQIYLSGETKETLDAAFDLAREFHDEYVSVEHLFLAMVERKKGHVAELLKKAGITKAAARRQIESLRGPHRVTDQDPETKYQSLAKYAKDLTELARKGKLDPVIGRDEEIRRVVQVLSRRTKNNPVLIGEPGVG